MDNIRECTINFWWNKILLYKYINFLFCSFLKLHFFVILISLQGILIFGTGTYFIYFLFFIFFMQITYWFYQLFWKLLFKSKSDCKDWFISPLYHFTSHWWTSIPYHKYIRLLFIYSFSLSPPSLSPSIPGNDPYFSLYLWCISIYWAFSCLSNLNVCVIYINIKDVDNYCTYCLF